VAGEDARRHRKKILPNEPKSSQMLAPIEIAALSGQAPLVEM
jgi:hypothetical protein